ncbi:DUF599 domain-containing protein [Aestuariivirga litoralis]|uniref:DUF599 domain-containing protein n=1 Tax=Aestuariivirga litoralis TaxID=2650924 RepID=UPI0018C66E77|nr:DUF599 domain-containing protein [Aestuariivirga litoralis]MBG1232892.1 DUF599 family protein [Aestuariivirga litoralis]
MNFTTELPWDFNVLHLLAPVLLFAAWWLYGPILDLLGKGTLNDQLHVVRLKWMLEMIRSNRQNRVFDGIMLGQISSAMSYFGSATLLVLAGFVGTLASINHVHASLTQMAFFPPISLGLFSVNFGALTLIMAICFFEFTYGLRKMAYVLAMIGALDEAPANTRGAEVMVAQTATVLTQAVKSMNNGIRGYYFAVAGLFLFLGPIASIVATVALSLVLYYRQGLSIEAKAVDRYVRALREDQRG